MIGFAVIDMVSRLQGALSLAAIGVAAARFTVPFDANWRFQLGEVAAYAEPCDKSAFRNFTQPDTKCDGGNQAMVFVSSPALCESACCGNPRCTYWEYCDNLVCFPKSPGWGCVNGYDECPTKKPATNWSGGVRFYFCFLHRTVLLLLLLVMSPLRCCQCCQWRHWCCCCCCACQ